MENYMENQTTRARKVIHIAGSLSLLLAPLGVAIGWGISYERFMDFFKFTFSSPYISSGTSDTVGNFLTLLTVPDGGFRYFLFPHYIIYASIPVFIAASLFLAHILFKKAPWHALIGSVLTSIGAVYFVGVLGAWLSFPAVLNIPADQINGLLPVLKALSTVQGALLVSTMLSILVFLGLIILGFGFYTSKLIPRWSAVLIILGNALIIMFAGTENWMTVGSLLMFIGMLPLALQMLHVNNIDHQV